MDVFFPDSTKYEEVQASPDDYVTTSEIAQLFSRQNVGSAFKFLKRGSHLVQM